MPDIWNGNFLNRPTPSTQGDVSGLFSGLFGTGKPPATPTPVGAFGSTVTPTPTNPTPVGAPGSMPPRQVMQPTPVGASPDVAPLPPHKPADLYAPPPPPVVRDGRSPYMAPPAPVMAVENAPPVTQPQMSSPPMGAFPILKPFARPLPPSVWNQPINTYSLNYHPISPPIVSPSPAPSPTLIDPTQLKPAFEGSDMLRALMKRA